MYIDWQDIANQIYGALVTQLHCKFLYKLVEWLIDMSVLKVCIILNHTTTMLHIYKLTPPGTGYCVGKICVGTETSEFTGIHKYHISWNSVFGYRIRVFFRLLIFTCLIALQEDTTLLEET